MLYVLKKEQIEHARLRALAQAIVSKDKGKEAFDDYMKVAFPWLEKSKGRDREDTVKLLLEEVKKGGLSIKPLWEEKAQSRLRHRIIEREPPPPAKPRDLNKLYDKLANVKTY